MNLYLISQTDNIDYDTYDSAVVAAPDEESAKRIPPTEDSWDSSWAKSPDSVKVKLIGAASPDIEQGVILASFNAG